jgi:hypothetical protein
MTATGKRTGVKVKPTPFNKDYVKSLNGEVLVLYQKGETQHTTTMVLQPQIVKYEMLGGVLGVKRNLLSVFVLFWG